MIIAYTSSYIKMVMRTLGSLAIKIVTCNENSPYTLEFMEEKKLLKSLGYWCISLHHVVPDMNQHAKNF